MINSVLIGLILASAFPVGYFLAWLCKDELKAGRRWFKILSWISLIGIFGLLLIYRDFSIILTLAYIAIVSLISVHKSYDKKFLRSLET